MATLIKPGKGVKPGHRETTTKIIKTNPVKPQKSVKPIKGK
jgi:hypothetical protein